MLCEVCGLHIESLKEHKCGQYTCFVCAKIFTSPEAVNKHVKKAMNEELVAATGEGGASSQQ